MTDIMDGLPTEIAEQCDHVARAYYDPGDSLTSGVPPVSTLLSAADEIRRLRAQLASRGPCAHCGGENPRGGLYCSDACRARHARLHAPGGRVRSSRSLVSGWSVVIHFPPEEADRASKFRMKDVVYVVEGDE